VDMPDGLCEALNPGAAKIAAPTIDTTTTEADCDPNINFRTGT